MHMKRKTSDIAKRAAILKHGARLRTNVQSLRVRVQLIIKWRVKSSIPAHCSRRAFRVRGLLRRQLIKAFLVTPSAVQHVPAVPWRAGDGRTACFPLLSTAPRALGSAAPLKL